MAEANRSSTDRRYFVTAPQDIPCSKILKGDHVLIDPDKTPALGRLAIIDDGIGLTLRPWNGEERVAGVPVQISRDVSHG